MKVALTFDAEHPDRPNCAPGTADAILDILAERDVRATFFLQGRWVEAYPAIARRIVDGGHLIGSHSFYHARMPLLETDGIVADVLAAERAIREATGADPRPWFRCPWGEGWQDPRVLEVLDGLGYRHVGWDVEAHDWMPDRTPTDVAGAIVRGVEGCEEAVALLHTWPEQNAVALPLIVSALEAAGTELVGVDDLTRVTRVAAVTG